MLKINKICKQFGEKKVLKEISFNVEKNCVVGLLGPNGAGKTTLMRVITGFLKANSGEIIWKGGKVDTGNIDYKSQVGYLPENNPLYLNLTVGEYLELIGNLKKINIGELEREIKETAKLCGVIQMLGQKVETLSKGFRQRVGLAASMLSKPKLLVLDEPTSGLDPNQIIEIRELIKKLAKDKIIILSTHILPEAKEICERLLIINRGEIVLDEETKKIKSLEKKFVELTV